MDVHGGVRLVSRWEGVRSGETRDQFDAGDSAQFCVKYVQATQNVQWN